MANIIITFTVNYYDAADNLLMSHELLRKQDFDADIENSRSKLPGQFKAVLLRETKEVRCVRNFFLTNTLNKIPDIT